MVRKLWEKIKLLFSKKRINEPVAQGEIIEELEAETEELIEEVAAETEETIEEEIEGETEELIEEVEAETEETIEEVEAETEELIEEVEAETEEAVEEVEVEAEEPIKEQVEAILQHDQTMKCVKKIVDCEFEKPYENRLALAWEKQGIIYTNEIGVEAVLLLESIPNIGRTSVKTFLAKFKGYVEWQIVRSYYSLEEWEGIQMWTEWAYEIHIDPLHAMDSIQSVFPGNLFNKWREFCEQNQIEYMKDLSYEHFKAFKQTPGVGKAKYVAVKEIVDQYRVEGVDHIFEEQMMQELLEKSISIKEEITTFLGAVKLESIAQFLSSPIPEILGDLQIRELHGYKIGDFVEVKDAKALDFLIQKLNLCPLPKEQLTAYRENPKNERTIRILEERFLEGYTLEKIGIALGIQRERVRQIQKKGIIAVQAIVETCKLREYMQMMGGGSAGVTREQLLTVIGEENSYVRGLLEKGHIIDISYHPAFELYLPMGQEMIDRATEEMMTFLPDPFKLGDYSDQIGTVLEKITIDYSEESIMKWLDQLGYYCYGPMISKTKFSHKTMLEVLFQEDFKEPLYLDEAATEQISQLAKKKYHYTIEPNLRAMDGRIRDAKEILLIDSRTYLHLSHIDYPEELPMAIRNYLEEERKTKQVINAGEVYERFAGQLQGTALDNKYGIYSLIKYYFEDYYNIGDGNTLNIYLDQDIEPITKEEMMLNLVAQHGGLMSKKDILKILKWEPFKLEDTLCKSKKMIPWGGLQVRCVAHLQESELLRSELKQLLEQHMGKSYIGNLQVYELAQTVPTLKQLLCINQIDEPNKLVAIIKLLVPEIVGHTSFLYHIASPVKTIEEAIVTQFKEGFTRKGLGDYLRKFGYGEVSIQNKIMDLEQKELVLELDRETLIPRAYFEVGDEFVTKLISVVEACMGRSYYISLDGINNLEELLGAHDYPHNNYFYKSVLRQHGFKVPVKYNRDYRYDMQIIVKEELVEINTFEELVYDLLQNHYIGEMNERAIYDYLVDQGLLREQVYQWDKKLPYGIKMYEGIQIEEDGSVELVG